MLYFCLPHLRTGSSTIAKTIRKRAQTAHLVTQEHHAIATQADAWFENYRFHEGESLPRLRIHYATLGSPHRDAQGKIGSGKQILTARGCLAFEAIRWLLPKDP